MNRRTIYIALFVAVAVLVTGVSVRKHAPLHWNVGDRQSYKIEASSVAESASSDLLRLNQRIDLRGILNMRVCEITGDRIVAAFQFSPVEISISGNANPHLEKCASSLFFADMSSDGRFLTFRFNGKDTSAEDSHALSGILRSVEFVVKKYSLFGSAVVGSEDVDGTFSVRYVYGKTIEKTMQSYTPRKDNTASIKRSKGTGSYDQHHSWIICGEYSDFIVYYSRKKAMLKVSSRTKIAITDTPSLPLAIWNEAIDYSSRDLVCESISSRSEEASAQLASAMTISLDEFRTQADAIFLAFKKYDPDCLARLIRLIASCPEAADYIPSMVEGLKLNTIQKIMLVHALERTGTSSAEKNLVRIMREPKCGIESRMQATVGLGTFTSVTSETTSSLWNIFTGSEDSQLRNAAVLSMGAIAKDGTGDEPAKIKDKIRSGFSSAHDSNEKTALLFAAGNTADTGMIPLIEEGLVDNRANVRAAAAGALSYMDDKESNPILSSQLQSESNPNVRTAIVSTLYKKSADDDTIGSTITALKKETNENVRGEIYHYLLKNRDADGVKEELSAMLPNEKSISNRNLIITALGTGKTSGKKQQR